MPAAGRVDRRQAHTPGGLSRMLGGKAPCRSLLSSLHSSTRGRDQILDPDHPRRSSRSATSTFDPLYRSTVLRSQCAVGMRHTPVKHRELAGAVVVVRLCWPGLPFHQVSGRGSPRDDQASHGRFGSGLRCPVALSMSAVLTARTGRGRTWYAAVPIASADPRATAAVEQRSAATSASSAAPISTSVAWRRQGRRRDSWIRHAGARLFRLCRAWRPLSTASAADHRPVGRTRPPGSSHVRPWHRPSGPPVWATSAGLAEPAARDVRSTAGARPGRRRRHQAHGPGTGIRTRGGRRRLGRIHRARRF
jgi:hypothetical protein